MKAFKVDYHLSFSKTSTGRTIIVAESRDRVASVFYKTHSDDVDIHCITEIDLTKEGELK